MGVRRQKSGRGRQAVLFESVESRVLMTASGDPFSQIGLDIGASQLSPGADVYLLAIPTTVGINEDPIYNGRVDFYLSSDATAGNGDDLLLGSGTTIPSHQGGAGRAYAAGTVPSSVTPGSYYLVAKTSTGAAYLGSQVQVVAAPSGNDLYGQGDHVWIWSTFASGDMFGLVTDIWNGGDTASPQTSFSLYFSPTPSLSTDAIFVKKLSVNSVPRFPAQGTYSNFVDNYAPIAPGTYYPILVIDPDNTVAEFDETNNVVVGNTTVTVTAPSVDLAITAVTAPAAIVPILPTDLAHDAQGVVAAVPVSATVRSSGSATQFALQFFLSTDEVAGNGDDVAIGELDYLSAAANGGESVYSGTVTLRFNGLLADGTYHLIARAWSASTDVTPADNTFVGPTVSTATVDVSLDVLSSAGTAVAGQSFTPFATAKVGGAYREVTVAYALSADEIVGNDDDIPLGRALVRARGTDFFEPPYVATTPSFVLPAGIAPGTYHLVATVDPDNGVAETDETNNTLVGPDVVVVAPELRATLTPGAAGGILAGTSARASLKLTNPAKHAVARSYLVKLYLSDDAAFSEDDTLFSRKSIVTSVGAGKTATINLAYALPKDSPLGTQYLIAVADVSPAHPAAKGLAAKSSATRVEASAKIQVVGPKLKASVLSVKKAGKPGTSAVTVRVGNVGTAAFVGFTTLKLFDHDGGSVVAKIERRVSIGRGRHVDLVLTTKGDPDGDWSVTLV